VTFNDDDIGGREMVRRSEARLLRGVEQSEQR